MQALFDFIQKLCALVMVALLAELLMPSGGMRKYVRLACGLLVIHIMVSQAFAIFGREMPGAEAQEWTQLIGEMRALPAEQGTEAALAAYKRRAGQLAQDKARSLGMSDPTVSIAWSVENQPVAIIIRQRSPAVEAGAGLGAPPPNAEEADTARIRSEMAAMLGLSEQAVLIQKEGEEGP